MKKIPILDLKKQIAPIRREIDAAVKRVIDNNDFILGKEVSGLENAIAKYCKVKYAVGVSNGTDALRLALLALGIKAGDGVICPAFTFYATAGAIASIGAIPVFSDIDPDTYNISLKSVKGILSKKRKFKIKAIIPVHLYGQCADMHGVLAIAKKYKLKVIEDAAQAFGAEYRGQKAGTIGNCGALSFFPSKNLSAFGDAGMVLTNNKYIAKRLKLLRNQGNVGYFHSILGHNHRMDGIQAAVLKIKLKHLDCWNKKRQKNAVYFNQQLKSLSIKIPFVPTYTTHIYHQYVLRLNSPSIALVEYLRNKGIDARVYYPLPLHLQECFKYLGYRKGDSPESEKAAKEILAIPVYPGLTGDEMEHIVKSIKEFLNG